MSTALKTTITLLGLVVALVVAATWAWSALSKPFPGLADAPVCVDTDVSAGATVIADQVTVSVLNAGTRAGLASQIMAGLLTQGFHEGDSGNAPAGTVVGYAQVWTDDENSPAVELLRAHLQRSKIVVMDTSQLDVAGVVLVVGDNFGAVIDGAASVEATQDTTICSPTS